jgi:hypothetical protein
MAVENGKATRLRVPRELPEPAEGTTAWSKQRGELKGFNAGLQAAAVFEHRAADPIKSYLVEKGAGRRSDTQYSAIELERCEFARRSAGIIDTQLWLTLLESPKFTPIRRALDFDRARNPAFRVARMVDSLDGVPSKSSMSRHNTAWNAEMRAMYWEGFARDLLEDVLALPGVADEIRSINLDGFLVPIAYTAPAYETKADGTIVVANSKYVTASEAGVLPRDSHGQGEDGFSMVSAWTSTGIPLCWDTGRNSDSEKTRGPALVRDQLAPILEPHLKSRRILGILTTDANFHSSAMREACRNAALVENIHIVSHVNRERASDFDTRWLPFQGYEKKWGTNGHHDVVCWCGGGRRTKIFDKLDDGTAVCRVEARCPTCGYICVTSGEWVYDAQLKAWSYRDPSNAAQRPDLSVGNGLTYNDPLSERYGRLRFSHHEGNHGALVTRWKLGAGKRYFRTLAELRVEIAMVMCSIYVAILEQHARASISEAELAVAA